MKNDEESESAKNSVAEDYFQRRAREKDRSRMRDYLDPAYAAGMEKLFGGAIEPPQRGSSKGRW